MDDFKSGDFLTFEEKNRREFVERTKLTGNHRATIIEPHRDINGFAIVGDANTVMGDRTGIHRVVAFASRRSIDVKAMGWNQKSTSVMMSHLVTERILVEKWKEKHEDIVRRQEGL
ncbi:hypothetical protein PROFUN_10286 [Planoprotostelium fungivorum]|uniref:Uncharacterized protein n=1 Tax=Planoprotostelium fungivorum TaxID=1890364 RepID=A0A2P6MRQ8_9EUKA|nr:hypothetical protein PROFUN_10286 [Planoprotostelium fungivorum]